MPELSCPLCNILHTVNNWTARCSNLCDENTRVFMVKKTLAEANAKINEVQYEAVSFIIEPGLDTLYTDVNFYGHGGYGVHTEFLEPYSEVER